MDDVRSQQLKVFQTETEAAASSVREVSKWIIGGVAIAVGGVVGGASLTSMGSLGWGWRLQLAAGSACVGLALLGYLLWFALGVISPRSYSLEDIANGKDMIPRRRKLVDARVRGLFPGSETSIVLFANEGMRLHKEAGESGASKVTIERSRTYDRAAEFVLASAKYEHLLILFAELRRRVFIITPLIALCFGVFAWAANPPKPIEKSAANVTVAKHVAVTWIGAPDSGA